MIAHTQCSRKQFFEFNLLYNVQNFVPSRLMSLMLCQKIQAPKALRFYLPADVVSTPASTSGEILTQQCAASGREMIFWRIQGLLFLLCQAIPNEGLSLSLAPIYTDANSKANLFIRPFRILLRTATAALFGITLHASPHCTTHIGHEQTLLKETRPKQKDDYLSYN